MSYKTGNMDADKKAVLTNSIFYTFGNILLKVFSFLLIPLYTAFLVPEQYGELNLATGFINVASCVVMGGLQYSVIRFYADIRENKTKVAHMLGTVICFMFLAGVTLATLFILSQKLWVKLLFEDIEFFPIVLLAILISLVSGIYDVYQASLKGMQRAKKSVTLSYIFFFLLLGANIITVVILRMGTAGILVSTLLINLIMVAIMSIDLRRCGLLWIGIDVSMLNELLKYSLPMLPHSLSFNISSFVTRIVINSKLSTATLGLFSLATQFGYIADMVCNSVQSAFQPWMFGKLKEAEQGSMIYRNEIRSLTYQLMWVYGLIYLLIGAFSMEAIRIMANDSYFCAWQYVPALIMAIAIKSPLYFYSNFLYYDKKKISYVFPTTLVGCIIVIALNFLLVPPIGIYGSVVADIIALLVRTTVIVFIVKNDAGEVYSLLRMALYTFIPVAWMCVSVVPSYMGLFHSQWTEVIYKTICVVSYCIMVIYIYRDALSKIILKRIHL